MIAVIKWSNFSGVIPWTASHQELEVKSLPSCGPAFLSPSVASVATLPGTPVVECPSLSSGGESPSRPAFLACPLCFFSGLSVVSSLGSSSGI